MEITPLGKDALAALHEFARRPEVARFGDHLETDPVSLWEAWLGEADPQRRMTIAAREGDRIRCAGRLVLPPHRRRIHCGFLSLLAPWSGDDDAIDAVLGALVEAADRWMQISRLELRAPAGHPRIEQLYARHGFAVETTMRDAILSDGALVDEVGLARIPDGLPPNPPAPPAPPLPPRRPTPRDLAFRPVEPRDAASWTSGLSQEAVVWGTMQLPHQRPEFWAKRFRDNDPSRIFLVAAESGGRLVGGGSLVVQGGFRRRHVASLGMHVVASEQGRGIGGALMREVLDLGDRLGLHRIELEVYPDNPRALRVYETAGFAHEGRRTRIGYRDGVYVDDLMMSRLSET